MSDRAAGMFAGLVVGIDETFRREYIVKIDEIHASEFDEH